VHVVIILTVQLPPTSTGFPSCQSTNMASKMTILVVALVAALLAMASPADAQAPSGTQACNPDYAAAANCLWCTSTSQFLCAICKPGYEIALGGCAVVTSPTTGRRLFKADEDLWA
jgi:hypothetical protein